MNIFMCGECMYVCMCECTCVEVKVDIKTLPWLFFHLFLCDGVSQSKQEPAYAANLTSYLALGFPYLHFLFLKKFIY